jgi:hypothetical protein
VERSRDLVGVGLAAFALINLVIALFAVIDPGAFYDELGPFGPQNDHYIRDAAGAMQGSLGVAMAIAIFRRSWRVGVLGYAVLHYTFHAANHLADIGEADPESVGVVDFVLLAVGACTLVWLLLRAVREERVA